MQFLDRLARDIRARLRNQKARLRAENGVVDLASIMVGILVLGIVAGVIAASLFGVIPWSQDQAAVQSLNSVKTAEAAYRVQASDLTYGDGNALTAANLLTKKVELSVTTGNSGQCWVAAIRSDAGNVFWIDSSMAVAKPLTAGDMSSCADLSTLAPLPAAPVVMVHDAGELSDAFANSADGTIVRAANDITVTPGGDYLTTSHQVSLDSAGHTITLSGYSDTATNQDHPAVEATKGGVVTFISSAPGGVLNVDNSDFNTAYTAAGIGAVASDDAGKFIFQSGTINVTTNGMGVGIGVERPSSDGSAVAPHQGAVFEYAGATVKVTLQNPDDTGNMPNEAQIGGTLSEGVDVIFSGGDVSAISYWWMSAIQLGQNGTVTFSGGHVHPLVKQSDGWGSNGAPAICVGATPDDHPDLVPLTISGGIITAETAFEADGNSGPAIGAGGHCQSNNPSKIVLSGGDLTTISGPHLDGGLTDLTSQGLPGFASGSYAYDVTLGHTTINGVAH
ncbi:hypothetical protein ACRAWC_01460 [Leifsonia sp. L25]|uniref:hypothetical protein n=1 Tax=Actinomycetes TaxID=1760 RepID=UPI003D686EAB